MRELLNEYGQTVLTALGAFFVLALAFTVVFVGGTRGLTGAAGKAAEVGGETSPGLSNAAAVAAANSATHTLTQQSDCITVGVPTAAGSIMSSTDTSAVFSVAGVTDENREDALENGSVSYDRKTHSVTANRRGIYSIEFRASGKQLVRKTVSITAL